MITYMSYQHRGARYGICYVGIAIIVFILLKSDGAFKAALIGSFWIAPLMLFMGMVIISGVASITENKSPR